jgi:hypothetical protein
VRASPDQVYKRPCAWSGEIAAESSQPQGVHQSKSKNLPQKPKTVNTFNCLEARRLSKGAHRVATHLSKTVNTFNAFNRARAETRDDRKALNLLKAINMIVVKNVQNARAILKVINMILFSVQCGIRFIVSRSKPKADS